MRNGTAFKGEERGGELKCWDATPAGPGAAGPELEEEGEEGEEGRRRTSLVNIWIWEGR